MIQELFMERLRDAHLEFFQISKKHLLFKRILYSLIVSMLFFIGISIGQASAVWFIGLPIAFLIGWKMPYLQLLLEKSSIDLKNGFLFLPFSQSFMVLLPSTGNVYQALKATVPYSQAPLNKKLEELIQKIEQGNNRQDYLDFAAYIGSPEAYMIMNMIYQFSEQGVRKEAILALQQYVQNIQENKVDQLIDSKMDTSFKISYLPMLLALFLVVAFALVLFSHYIGTIIDALSVLPKGE
ncbi:hypothetical protein A0U40_03500 [[Bacillus] sp. KCTC 13219]|nr:hypothetical protein A0U40_03500 [[Bacillus] sp. KCTC 13219]